MGCSHYLRVMGLPLNSMESVKFPIVATNVPKLIDLARLSHVGFCSGFSTVFSRCLSSFHPLRRPLRSLCQKYTFGTHAYSWAWDSQCLPCLVTLNLSAPNSSHLEFCTFRSQPPLHTKLPLCDMKMSGFCLGVGVDGCSLFRCAVAIKFRARCRLGHEEASRSAPRSRKAEWG
jgi:hypothetical protein